MEAKIARVCPSKSPTSDLPLSSLSTASPASQTVLPPSVDTEDEYDRELLNSVAVISFAANALRPADKASPMMDATTTSLACVILFLPWSIVFFLKAMSRLLACQTALRVQHPRYHFARLSRAAFRVLSVKGCDLGGGKVT